MPRKKSPTTKRSIVHFADFLVEIGQWRLPYSFSVGHGDRIAPGPYWEHVALVIDGVILYPKKFNGKEVEIYVIGDRNEVRILSGQEDPGEWKPACVGTLTLRGSERKYLGSLPMDVVWSIGLMLQAGTYRYVCLHGEAMFRGVAKIRSIRFEKTVDPDDYPEH